VQLERGAALLIGRVGRPFVVVGLEQFWWDPHTYRVGTGTRGTAMPNGTAARYQANAADSAPGSARARA
jgi:hypothetical protein